MLKKIAAALVTCGLLLGSGAVPHAANAEPLQFQIDPLKKRKTSSSRRPSTTLRSWMSPEIANAWRQGYYGQGVALTFVDDFKSRERSYGNLGSGIQRLRHGEWTRGQARMLAPSASTRSHDLGSSRRISLGRGLNVVNLSYGMFAPVGYDVDRFRWSAREASLISYAHKGRAVISKAAGNDGVAVDAAGADGMKDYLNQALIGGRSTIFVGALDSNGTAANPASLASYSNFAGNNHTVQRQFLVVGVEGDRTGLYGTSFAAPVVSGYSAVLGSKFKGASASQITNRLLSTARTDTIDDYNAAVHGRGEASIARALAPRSIR